MTANDLNVSDRTLYRNEARFHGSIVAEMETRSKQPKLFGYEKQLFGFLDEFMPIKSGTNYRLQMISDTELWERMGIYMKENYGLEVSSKTYRKWV